MFALDPEEYTPLRGSSLRNRHFIHGYDRLPAVKWILMLFGVGLFLGALIVITGSQSNGGETNDPETQNMSEDNSNGRQPILKIDERMSNPKDRPPILKIDERSQNPNYRQSILKIDERMSNPSPPILKIDERMSNPSPPILKIDERMSNPSPPILKIDERMSNPSPPILKIEERMSNPSPPILKIDERMSNPSPPILKIDERMANPSPLILKIDERNTGLRNRPESHAFMKYRKVDPDSSKSSHAEKSIFWNGSFRYEGTASATTKAPLFGTLVEDKAQVFKVELRNVTIDAQALSYDLNGCVNLKSIILSNVFIIGEFERTTLPSLETFILHQIASPGETKEDYENDPAKLKSRLFFDKFTYQNWDLKKELTDLGTEIEFALDGVTIVKIFEESEEISLHVPYCEEILQTVSWTVSTLTLVGCNITASSIPTNLLYFNVYKVWILEGGTFTQIIKAFTRITDFYGQIPGEVINLSDFPNTLTTLTLIDTELDYRDNYHSSIVNLSIGYKLSTKVLDSIVEIMDKLQRVAIFGLPAENDGSALLEKLLVNTTVGWIAVEDYKRNPNTNYPIQQWVEQCLTELGIPENANNFLISSSRNGKNGNGRSGRALSDHEADYYHYALLGWYKITTYEAYSTIQKRKLANLNNNG